MAYRAASVTGLPDKGELRGDINTDGMFHFHPREAEKAGGREGREVAKEGKFEMGRSGKTGRE